MLKKLLLLSICFSALTHYSSNFAQTDSPDLEELTNLADSSQEVPPTKLVRHILDLNNRIEETVTNNVSKLFLGFTIGAVAGYIGGEMYQKRNMAGLEAWQYRFSGLVLGAVTCALGSIPFYDSFPVAKARTTLYLLMNKLNKEEAERLRNSGLIGRWFKF